MNDNNVCEHQNANCLRMMTERDEARRALADLRAGIEALADEYDDHRRPRGVHRFAVADRLRALLAGSGEQPDGEGVTVEWGVGYGDQRIATESREEAEEWIADDDAWATGEKRWLIMRQVGPWTRAANARNVERLEKTLAILTEANDDR